MHGESLATLEAWLQPLLDQLQPAERRHLARDLARGLRTRQAQRIANQRNVDGSPYKPRTERRNPGALSRQRDRIGAMFAKLRTTQHLRATANPGTATVEFTGRAARIASVHQYGLFDLPQDGGPKVRYPVRELLGVSSDDLEWLQAALRKRLIG